MVFFYNLGFMCRSENFEKLKMLKNTVVTLQSLLNSFLFSFVYL